MGENIFKSINESRGSMSCGLRTSINGRYSFNEQERTKKFMDKNNADIAARIAKIKQRTEGD